MEKGLGFKELYEVSLKATYPIEVGNSKIEAGETVMSFDRIQLANFQEIKNTASSNGGFDNRSHIYWDSTKEIKLSLSQGVFSKKQLALMTNANLIDNLGEQIILLNKCEEFESNENGEIFIGRDAQDPMFVYDKNTGKKITDWTYANGIMQINKAYQSVIIDYWYEYNNGYTILKIGSALTHGYFSLIGKMRVKDDDTGKVTTGIIKIPKLRLMSDLSMRLGSDAIPQVGRLDAVAVPEGGRGQQKVMEIIFLNDDIDADM